MGLRLVPKSMTLNDLGPLFCVVLPNAVALGANYVKAVIYRPIPSATKL